MLGLIGLLTVSGILFFGIDAVFADRFRDFNRRNLVFIGQRLQRRDRDEVPVDLEERSERSAIIGAAEAVSAEDAIAVRAPTGGSGWRKASCSRSTR